MKKLLLAVCLFTLAPAVVVAEQPDQRTGAARKLESARDVEYGRAGERSLKLDIYQPRVRSSEKLPAIVWIHGGGWRNGDKSSGRSRLANFVNTGDYVGVSVGYRLSGEAVWPAQIHDCKAAIRWVRAHADEHGIDPDRIGVWGSSAGGHLVSLLGVSSDVKELEGENGTPGVSSRVACVVDFCGPAEMVIFRHTAADLLFGKPPAERKVAAALASPALHATQDDPPFLVVHGTEDRTVPIEQADLFHKKLQEAGVDVTYVKIQGGGHSIGGPEVQQRVTAFFDKHLRGQDVTVSADPIQAPASR